MLIKGFVEEDFIQYKLPQLFIGTCFCDWKCCKEAKCDLSLCQNQELAQINPIEVPNQVLLERYLNNPITKAITIGGLEPFKQFEEVYELIKFFRENGVKDDFVIYTGYYENEIKEEIKKLKKLKNIVIKFGRFIPFQEKKYDKVLGITLSQKNQYGKRI